VISTAEFVLRLATQAQVASGTILLDFQRVHSIDGAAQQLIQLFVAQASAAGRDVVLCGLHEDLGAPNLLQPDGSDNAYFFATLDEALEWCEDRILSAGSVGANSELEPSEHSMLSRLEPDELDALLPMLALVKRSAGSRIITQDDDADCVYLLTAGTAAVTLQLSDGREHRIALLGPDATFGEIALIDNEPRTAHVDAVSDVVCYALNVAELDATPGGEAIRAKLVEYLAREMAMRLRRADAEIAALAL
jgi:CRP-like cAMP-binding protein